MKLFAACSGLNDHIFSTVKQKREGGLSPLKPPAYFFICLLVCLFVFSFFLFLSFSSSVGWLYNLHMLLEMARTPIVFVFVQCFVWTKTENLPYLNVVQETKGVISLGGDKYIYTISKSQAKYWWNELCSISSIFFWGALKLYITFHLYKQTVVWQNLKLENCSVFINSN